MTDAKSGVWWTSITTGTKSGVRWASIATGTKSGCGGQVSELIFRTRNDVRRYGLQLALFYAICGVCLASFSVTCFLER
jgi:hypothetical protein